MLDYPHPTREHTHPCIFAPPPSKDEEEDNEAVAGSLVDALVESNALELLVERLTKMNEAVDEEAAAVNNALALIEHAVEVSSDMGRVGWG